MQQNQQSLLQLVYAKENQEFQEIKKKFSEFVKYFFNIRRNITMAYDKSTLYIIHKQYFRIIDLGKNYLITNIAYNYKKNIILFVTQDCSLYAYFISTKTKIQIKHDFNKVITMEWIYSPQQTVSFFIAEEGGIHMYKMDEEKKEKGIKQVKHISGKYHSFLYEPITQYLAAFHYGDCNFAYLFHFDAAKAKNWFRNGEIEISFGQDETVVEMIRAKKRFGLEGNRIGKAIAINSNEQQNFIDIRSIQNTPYMIFYYSNEGKLQLTPLIQSSDKKQVIIKLPSNSPPSFNVFDNMLVVHLRNQRITFIYDINPSGFQPLVSPYPLLHEDSKISQKIYSSEFVGYRVILPNGHISKWRLKLSVIYNYLKNQMQIFQFLTRRATGKIQTIKWMRQKLFTFKQINLSKMWKTIFTKINSGTYDESQIISMIEIYSNLFYTLSIDPLVSKVSLVNILMQCLRQAYQYRIPVPNQLQLFTVDLLLTTQKYDLLAFLCHHSLIKSDNKIYQIIYDKGEALRDETLVTLSVDLAYQNATPKTVLKIIMKSQRIKEAKRYVKSNFQKINPLDILQSAKYIRNIDAKLQFVSYFRNFIPHNYPNINKQILLQAQKKLFQ